MRSIRVKGTDILFDDEGYELLKAYTINFQTIKGKIYVYANVNRKTVSINKILFKTDQRCFVTYKNGNQFDFRRENIEIVSKAQFSRKLEHNHISKYFNVYYNLKHKMWFSSVQKHGKRIYGGRYYLEEEAAIASDVLNLKGKYSLKRPL